MGIDGGAHHRLRPARAIPGSCGSGRNLLHLSGPAIEAGDLAAVDNVRIEWIGRDISVLLGAHGRPVAECDRAIVAAARHTRGSALLLSAADAVGERGV